MPVDRFRRDSRGYVRSHCNPCALEVTRQWRARNREALLARRRAADKNGETRPRAHRGEARALSVSCRRVPAPGTPEAWR